MDQPVVDRRLDPRYGQPAIAGTQAILRPGYSVSLIDLSAGGALIEGPRPLRPGSRVHDEIVARVDAGPGETVVARPTNRAGGLEGGVTNGEELRVSGFMKPISTLMKPLRSVDLATMDVSPATIERSDVCAVPAAAVVGEAMVAIVVADAAIEKFGGDSLQELVANWRSFRDRTAARFARV